MLHERRHVTKIIAMCGVKIPQDGLKSNLVSEDSTQQEIVVQYVEPFHNYFNIVDNHNNVCYSSMSLETSFFGYKGLEDLPMLNWRKVKKY
jgi:hypothetical protein